MAANNSEESLGNLLQDSGRGRTQFQTATSTETLKF